MVTIHLWQGKLLFWRPVIADSGGRHVLIYFGKCTLCSNRTGQQLRNLSLDVLNYNYNYTKTITQNLWFYLIIVYFKYTYNNDEIQRNKKKLNCETAVGITYGFVSQQ